MSTRGPPHRARRRCAGRGWRSWRKPRAGASERQRLKDLQDLDRITAVASARTRRAGGQLTPCSSRRTTYRESTSPTTAPGGDWPCVNFPFRYCKPWEAIENKGTDLPAELGLRDGPRRRGQAARGCAGLAGQRRTQVVPGQPGDARASEVGLDATREWRETADLSLGGTQTTAYLRPDGPCDGDGAVRRLLRVVCSATGTESGPTRTSAPQARPSTRR